MMVGHGIPVSLMEAMYSRIPVVSTAISGIPELIEHGYEGVLIADPGETEKFAAEIKKLLDEEDWRAKMAESAFRKVNSMFDIQREVDKLLAIWNRIINRAEDNQETI